MQNQKFKYFLTHYWLAFAKQPNQEQNVFSLPLIGCKWSGDKEASGEVPTRFPLFLWLNINVYLVCELLKYTVVFLEEDSNIYFSYLQEAVVPNQRSTVIFTEVIKLEDSVNAP